MNRWACVADKHQRTSNVFCFFLLSLVGKKRSTLAFFFLFLLKNDLITSI